MQKSVQPEVMTTSRSRRIKHELKRKEGNVRITRIWCHSCYEDNVTSHDRKYAKNKTKMWQPIVS